MEGWGLLFKVRKYYVWSGGGQSGQTCPNFIRGDPVGSIRKEKILTKIGGKLDMLQANFWLFFCWDILVLARYEVGKVRSNRVKRASNGGGMFYANLFGEHDKADAIIWHLHLYFRGKCL